MPVNIYLSVCAAYADIAQIFTGVLKHVSSLTIFPFEK